MTKINEKQFQRRHNKALQAFRDALLAEVAKVAICKTGTETIPVIVIKLAIFDYIKRFSIDERGLRDIVKLFRWKCTGAGPMTRYNWPDYLLANFPAMNEVQLKEMLVLLVLQNSKFIYNRNSPVDLGFSQMVLTPFIEENKID